MDDERSRALAYLLVALAGFVAGVAIGQLGAGRDPCRAGIESPGPALPHPRALQP